MTALISIMSGIFTEKITLTNSKSGMATSLVLNMTSLLSQFSSTMRNLSNSVPMKSKLTGMAETLILTYQHEFRVLIASWNSYMGFQGGTL